MIIILFFSCLPRRDEGIVCAACGDGGGAFLESAERFRTSRVERSACAVQPLRGISCCQWQQRMALLRTTHCSSAAVVVPPHVSYHVFIKPEVLFAFVRSETGNDALQNTRCEKILFNLDRPSVIISQRFSSIRIKTVDRRKLNIFF